MYHSIVTIGSEQWHSNPVKSIELNFEFSMKKKFLTPKGHSVFKSTNRRRAPRSLNWANVQIYCYNLNQVLDS